MSANIQTMAYQGARPWHGLGVEVPADVKSAAMIKAAGLDWEVRLDRLMTDDRVVTTHKAVVRRDTKQVLGVVGNAYRPVQNRTAFDFLDTVVANGDVQYHTAGALGGGERVWVLAKLPGVMSPVKGDAVEKFLLFSNSHDGGGALRVMFTPIRVVCQNTLNAAIGQFNKKEGVAIRHVGNMDSKIDAAAQALGLARKFYDAVEQSFAKMAGFKISYTQAQAVLDGIFPIKETDRQTRESMVGNAGIQHKILDLSQKGRGSDLPGVKGTAWGLYNAITEYVDHERTTTGKTPDQKAENRLRSQWFGSGAALKSRAFDSVMALVG